MPIANNKVQTKVAVRCSIILPAGEDYSKLSEYLWTLDKTGLNEGYELVVINDRGLEIDEGQLRASLPALKVLNPGGALREGQLFDTGAMAAKGEFLLFVRSFVNFDKLVLEESIKDLETSREEVSISASKNFVLMERSYYFNSPNRFDFGQINSLPLDKEDTGLASREGGGNNNINGSPKSGEMPAEEEILKMQNLFAEIRNKSPQLASIINTLESLQNQIIKTQADVNFFENPNANTEIFRKHPPGHFYTPIPSLEEIKSREEQIFGTPPRQIPGIDLNEEGQLQLLDEFKRFYKEQPFSPTKTGKLRYYFENGNYGYTDGIFLHCMIRYLRPKRIVEVGCGSSSCNMLDTNALFFDHSIDLTFIDPNPEWLYANMNIKSTDYTNIRVIPKQVQVLALDLFSVLDENDILFIDSSHVSKIGSDVNYIVFEILPCLKKGVYVHFHDIRYPFEYPKEWIYNGHAWNEAYLVRAFLQFNKNFEIAFFNGYLRYFFENVFREYMPLCLKHPGGSLWIKKISYGGC